MSGKGGGGRDESLKALRCVVDWWVGGGAPNRKLKYFRDQPLLHPQVSDEFLLIWYFEDWLKKYFFSILQILETLSLDPLPYVRTQAISLISTLLKDKPEQEQNLLRLLVNKLGDTSKSICSRASYHLLQLLQTHPSMKSIIVREIISLVLKPSAPSTSTATTPTTPGNKHIRFSSPEPATKSKSKSTPQDKKPRNTHAQYYATITFNQIVLTPSQSDREVAVRLIDIYFELFKDVLGAEGTTEVEETDEQLLEKDGEVQKDKKGRVLVRDKKRKGTKDKEFNGAAGFVEVEDSNSKLISALLTGVNRALPFAKVEMGDTKINAHLDTLFLITHKSTFNISIQALVLIQQISLTISKASSTSAKPTIDRYFRTLYESLHDSRLGTSSKQAMYLNLLYKSIKADPEQSTERKKALIKRFVQVLASGGSGATEFIAGGLYLLGELFSTIPGLRSMIFNAEKKGKGSETYDPRKRDPLYAHADDAPIWELTPLLYHYHPTVSLLARQLLAAQPLTATADLAQNTLSHFLDRFVYKNPKKKPSGVEGKGASAMQPAGSALEGVKLRKGEVPNVQVNQPAFWNKKENQVPVDQLFFYSYFKRKDELERKMKKKQEKGEEGEDEEESDDGAEDEEEEKEDEGKGPEEDGVEDGEDEEEDGSELKEAEIWKAMKATMPKEGDDADLLSDSDIDEDDDLPSDFSAAMASDNDDDLVFNEDDISEGESEPEAADGSEANSEAANEESDKEGDDSDEDLSFAEGSDNEDLIPLDELPDGLIAYDSSDGEAGEEEDEWQGISSEKPQKRKRGVEEKNSKRKKLRSLPTFASYEEYAKMIEDGPEDDI
ncbi:CBF-domain-containing protein [Macrolepiota fuliginosa MF-IS2]|uniref:CBF-domain-containing protein n=1 Tax=Macrolepiota fuliginosa MF-IS2 TaxID=1400762 RepID=A0A9P5XBP4_9AGAR|nr:CBF-domain-containing protein [Macrolepiota fuliginosa MF-IS2]